MYNAVVDFGCIGCRSVSIPHQAHGTDIGLVLMSVARVHVCMFMHESICGSERTITCLGSERFLPCWLKQSIQFV